MRAFTMRPFMWRGMRVLLGAAVLAIVSAAPLMQLTEWPPPVPPPPPNNGGTANISIQASGTYDVSLTGTGGPNSSQTTIFSPPQACQSHAPYDKTVGYYLYQGALYQVDVAVCPVTTSKKEINKLWSTMRVFNIHEAWYMHQLVHKFIKTQTQQVCNAINNGRYFDLATEAGVSPYDKKKQQFTKHTLAAYTLPWRPYARHTFYKTFESYSYHSHGGAGSCAVRYSLRDQSPPTVKLTTNWLFQDSVSGSLSAPPPHFNVWQPVGAFGNELNVLASEAEQDAGYPQGSIALQFPTWPTGTFADPKTVGGSLESVPWPVGVPLAVQPTGDPTTASVSLNGSGSVIVYGTATISQSGITTSVPLLATKIGTWQIRGNVNSNITGYDVYGPDLTQQNEFCSMNQVNTSQAIFNGVPNAMNESYLDDNMGPLTDVKNMLPAACTIQYMNNPANWSGAPYGDPPVYTSGVYGQPTGQATVTVEQTRGSVTVDGINVPIHLPGSSCSITIDGSNGQSSGSWCKVSTDLSGFTTQPSQPLYLHPTAFNAIAVPTGN
jgi:hypothetical protein